MARLEGSMRADGTASKPKAIRPDGFWSRFEVGRTIAFRTRNEANNRLRSATAYVARERLDWSFVLEVVDGTLRMRRVS
jgi:hypothetical protein